ncbi:hypothetical protein B4135_2139 [Caldibacillus debilis]|uniref:Uncharacterized protein n=1 Tax=Caldibacillus debilis TaxID=301148 RepID=A0A150M487_9BACI|nr:hypothetical protein B4135_2139 [Caldibacillus debilis]
MNNKKQEIKRKKENLHVGGAPEGRQCHRLARSPACGDIPKGYAALNEEDFRRTEGPPAVRIPFPVATAYSLGSLLCPSLGGER